MRRIVVALVTVALFLVGCSAQTGQPQSAQPSRQPQQQHQPHTARSTDQEPPANMPLLTDLTDLSTIPGKNSAIAKAADPCKVISDAEIKKIFENREVTFYREDNDKGRPVPNNPQLIRPCTYIGIMMNGDTRVNMTFEVVTSLDNSGHEDWKIRTKDLKQHDFVDSNIFHGTVIGGYTGHKGQVIVEVMPSSENPGITDQDALALTRIALARLP